MNEHPIRIENFKCNRGEGKGGEGLVGALPRAEIFSPNVRPVLSTGVGPWLFSVLFSTTSGFRIILHNKYRVIIELYAPASNYIRKTNKHYRSAATLITREPGRPWRNDSHEISSGHVIFIIIVLRLLLSSTGPPGSTGPMGSYLPSVRETVFGYDRTTSINPKYPISLSSGKHPWINTF